MNLRAVIFDIAGTTVSDKGFVKEAFTRSFQKNGFSISGYEADAVMGYKKITAIQMIVDQNNLQWDNQMIQKVHHDFSDEMKNIYSEVDVLPLPGVIETFEWLQSRNIPFGLNTGFTRDITDALLNRLHWNETNYAKYTICSDEVPEGRPAPFMIQRLLEYFDVENASECIKVGDTEVDILEGKNSGCKYVIALTTGSSPRSELQKYKPDFIIDHMDELITIIQNNFD